MSKLVVRTDDVLSVLPADVALLTDAGFAYEQIPCVTEEDIISAAANASGLLVLAEPVTANVIGSLPKLEVIARFGVGLDTVDVEAATNAGVRVVNVPDANSKEVAHHAVAMILALVRRLPHLHELVAAGGWSYLDAARGVRRLSDLRVGILGAGRIGRLVARHCHALGFEVVAHDPQVSPQDLGAVGGTPVTFDELVSTCDVLSIHVPLTDSTRNLIDADVIAKTKQDAVVVNVSRGGLVDEHAVAEALRQNHLSGAAFDTFATEPLPGESPLRGAPGVIMTPHAAHYSQQSFRETIHRAFSDTARVLAGEEPRDPVN